MHFVVDNSSFNPHKISHNFSKKAQNYQQYSQIQQKSSSQLYSLAQKYLSSAKIILDAGSGTSIVGKTWQFADSAQIYEVDFALSMLQSWQNRPSNFFPVLADINHLPFCADYFDFIVSSFVLQWLSASALFSLHKVLKQNALLAVALPNANSLQNLTNLVKINDLPSHQQFHENLLACGFTIIHHSWQDFSQSFISFKEAVSYFKNIGANTKNHQHNNFLTLLKQKNSWQKPINLDWQVSFFLAQKISSSL
jgi:SAM-dependent methyltransferase